MYSDAVFGRHSSCVRGDRVQTGRGVELRHMEDLIYYGLAFVFLGVCLLYVRAADKL